MLVISVRSHPGALGHLLEDAIDGTLGQAIAGLSPRLEHKYRRRPIAAVDGGSDATRNRSPMRWFSAANPHCIVALQSARLRHCAAIQTVARLIHLKTPGVARSKAPPLTSLLS